MKTCKHVGAVVRSAKRQGVEIWSEDGNEPDGWVNIRCRRCMRIWQLTFPGLFDADEYVDAMEADYKLILDR